MNDTGDLCSGHATVPGPSAATILDLGRVREESETVGVNDRP